MYEIKKKTILLVEDEALIGIMEKQQLEREGYNVILSPSGEKAIEIVCIKNEPVDLILMDIDLKTGVDGTEAAIEILKKHEIPVVFLSSHTEKEIVRKTEKITSYGYVVKDSGIIVLDASIKMAFRLFEANRKTEDRNEQLKTILHSIGDAVIATDTDGKIIQMNPVAENLTGWKFGEASGKPLSEVFNIVNSHTRKSSRNPVERVLRSGRIVGLANHTLLISRNGTEYQISDSGSPITDAGGNITGVVLVFRDITEEYRIRRKIEESENKFRNLFNNAEVGMFRTRFDGSEILDANEKFLNIFDRKKDEVIGKPSVIHWADPDERDEMVRMLKEHNRVNDFECRIVDSHGNIKHCLTSLVLYPEQEILEGSIIDISERKKMEDELKKTSTLLEQAFEQSPVPMVLVSMPDGIIRIVNPALKDFLDINDEPPAIGKSLLDYVPSYEDFDSSGNPGSVKDLPLARALRGEKTYNEERRVVTKSGMIRWELASAAPILNEKGEILAGYLIMMDITRQKEAEEKIMKLYSEKELVLREVHHRIKNNVNTINSLLSIQADMQKSPSAKKILQDAAKRIQNMKILYDKLYLLEMKKSMSLKEYFSGLIEEVVGLFPNKSSIDIKTNIDDIVLSEKLLSPLGIIINELITNSMKYAFAGLDSGAITVAASRKGKRIFISYEDNGTGLPENITLENSKGFGLRLVGMLIQQINGHITIERDKGTKFLIEFEK